MYNSLLETIGNTPLVKVDFGTKSPVYAKLEYLNPGGSIKDRSALYMVEYAERQGLLKPGGTLIDASSGNHGIALAMIGRVKGYRVIVTVTSKISTEKLKTLKAYGAEVVVCPPTPMLEDPKSYHSVAKAIQAKTPNSYMPNQYFRKINAEGHYYSTGPEIWEQTKGQITHLIAGVGTAGTLSGAGKFLKEMKQSVVTIGVDSINSYRATKGNPKPYIIEGIGIDFESEVLDKTAIDEIVPVSDEEAIEEVQILAKEQGILAGLSSGAVASVTRRYMRNLSENYLAVMIFGDSGRAYLSKLP